MAGTLDFPFSPDLHNSWLVEYVAVSNFPKLVFLKTGIPKNSKTLANMLLSSLFWHSTGLGYCFFSLHMVYFQLK